MTASIKDILTRLAGTAHRGGAFSSDVLMAIADVLPQGDIVTLETGCGKSSVMFSNLSARHFVFAYDDRGAEGSSVEMVQNDPEFRSDRTEWVFGPTQKTIPAHTFDDGLAFDVILIDGPHGYPFPDLEYAFLYPRLKTGGILILDDVHIPSIGNMYGLLREDRMYEEIGVFATTGLLRRTGIEGVPADGDHWYEQSYNFARFPLSMAKYHRDRSVVPGAEIHLADPHVLARHAIKSVEACPDQAAARTIDIGATLEFSVPETAGPDLHIALQYRSAYADAARDAMVAIGGKTWPLPAAADWSTLDIRVRRPASGRLVVTLVHPHANSEHHRETKRYEFRRLGSLLRSITISAADATPPAPPVRDRERGFAGRLARLLRR